MEKRLEWEIEIHGKVKIGGGSNCEDKSGDEREVGGGGGTSDGEEGMRLAAMALALHNVSGECSGASDARRRCRMWVTRSELEIKRRSFFFSLSHVLLLLSPSKQPRPHQLHSPSLPPSLPLSSVLRWEGRR